MLISVHLPKTAGSSFRFALETFYVDSLELDYGDFPVNKSAFARNTNSIKSSLGNVFKNQAKEFRCIHGHFMPLKYRWLKAREEKKFTVWLRDPIERLASHYYYWKRDYKPEEAGKLRKQVVEDEWSLERFCFSTEMQNTYTKFFWGFPVSRFDFIGITENYESDLNYFSKHILGAELQLKSENINTQKKSFLYINDSDLRLRLERFHQRDMRLYQKALAISQTRKTSGFFF